MWWSEAEEVPSDVFYSLYENDDKFICSKFSAGLCMCVRVCARVHVCARVCVLVEGSVENGEG